MKFSEDYEKARKILFDETVVKGIRGFIGEHPSEELIAENKESKLGNEEDTQENYLYQCVDKNGKPSRFYKAIRNISTIARHKKESTRGALVFEAKDETLIERLKNRIESGSTIWGMYHGYPLTEIMNERETSKPHFNLMAYRTSFFPIGEIAGVEAEYKLAKSLIEELTRK
tara:strand:- start:47 stop:562 length:516 start_codon:yes stop_codon:yes gene_type:complete